VCVEFTHWPAILFVLFWLRAECLHFPNLVAAGNPQLQQMQQQQMVQQQRQQQHAARQAMLAQQYSGQPLMGMPNGMNQMAQFNAMRAGPMARPVNLPQHLQQQQQQAEHSLQQQQAQAQAQAQHQVWNSTKIFLMLCGPFRSRSSD
jgi:hypothetical protein